MTDPIVYDSFPIDLDDKRFMSVVVKEVTIETIDEAIDRVVHRGIYGFATRKQRDLFTKVCNADQNKSIAFNFNRRKD